MQALSLESLCRAIEHRDGKTLASFYAPDAVLRIIDQNHPPSRPQEFRGHDAIAAYFDDVCGRAMTHRAESGIVDGDRLAFTQTCTYPDGKQVVCAAMLHVADGKIAEQTAVQAWDS